MKDATSLCGSQCTGKGVSNTLTGHCPQWTGMRSAILCEIWWGFLSFFCFVFFLNIHTFQNHRKAWPGSRGLLLQAVCLTPLQSREMLQQRCDAPERLDLCYDVELTWPLSVVFVTALYVQIAAGCVFRATLEGHDADRSELHFRKISNLWNTVWDLCLC